MEKILEKRQIVIDFSVKEIIEEAPKTSAKTSKNAKTDKLSFADIEWDKFIALVRAGKTKEHFKVGDKRKIKLVNGEEITIAIAGFDHDVDEKGNILPVTLTFVDCLSEKFAINVNGGNKGDWDKCDMRNKTMPYIFSLIPTTISDCIVASKKDNKTVDKLFLPSEVEVWGKNWYGKDDESNKQYEFFKNKYNRIKFCTDNDIYAQWYWLRSPYSGSGSIFCMVTSNGSYGDNSADVSIGVAPCFAIA